MTFTYTNLRAICARNGISLSKRDKEYRLNVGTKEDTAYYSEDIDDIFFTLTKTLRDTGDIARLQSIERKFKNYIQYGEA